MANMLVCTGKKKAVGNILGFFRKMESDKKIDIYAHVQRTKKAMIWNYEELKVLFLSKGSKKLEIERKLVKAVDFIQIRTPRGVVMKFSSFKTEEKEIKWNIISRTTTFQLKGGRLDIREDVQKANHRESRICHVTLAGPAASVITLKDLLIKEEIIDPKTLEFIL